MGLKKNIQGKNSKEGLKTCKRCQVNYPEKCSKTCCKCRHEIEKERDPERYFYGVLKRNAKRRGHEFNLTLDEFRKFCLRTEYINKKGIKRNSLTIDRIDETKGYRADNIQVLKNHENVKKYVKWISRDQHGKSEFKTFKKVDETKQGDCPF